MLDLQSKLPGFSNTDIIALFVFAFCGLMLLACIIGIIWNAYDDRKAQDEEQEELE